MIKHILFLRLKESAHGNDKATNARLVKEKLESLNGKIPGLLKLEVGIDFLSSEDSSDIALYSELTDREALELYQAHPAHMVIKPFVADTKFERRVTDADRALVVDEEALLFRLALFAGQPAPMVLVIGTGTHRVHRYFGACGEQPQADFSPAHFQREEQHRKSVHGRPRFAKLSVRDDLKGRLQPYIRTLMRPCRGP